MRDTNVEEVSRLLHRINPLEMILSGMHYYNIPSYDRKYNIVELTPMNQLEIRYMGFDSEQEVLEMLEMYKNTIQLSREKRGVIALNPQGEAIAHFTNF